MTETAATVADPPVDDRTRALLRNDLSGMSRADIASLVAELATRMGVDPALAPVDIIPTKVRRADGSWGERLSLYINARGAAELAKRHELSDDSLDIDIRDASRVVIVQGVKSAPDGRTVRDVGASSFDPERPDSLAKAIKSAATSAHRRTTLRMVGIFLSEPPDLAAVDAE
jgi:hypothetical protein